MVLSEAQRYRLAQDLNYQCRGGDLERVKELLDQGASLDTSKYGQSDTLLNEAVFSGNKDLVLFLLSLHMSVDAAGRDGLRPLHIAVIEKNLEMVELLLSKGAFPTATDGRGREPIHFSESNGKITQALRRAKEKLRSSVSKPDSVEIEDLKAKERLVSDNGRQAESVANAAPRRGRPRAIRK